MRFQRPCLECQKLHTDYGDYCAACRREVKRRIENNPNRRIRKQALYTSAYRKAAKLIKETATHCHICKQPFESRADITADHIIAGDADSPLLPAHKTCNSRRGNTPLDAL